jgi:hypothetical protein
MRDKDLDKKIEALIKEKREKDVLENDIDIYVAIDSYLNECKNRNKKWLCMNKSKKVFQNKYNLPTKKHQVLNYTVDDKNVELCLTVKCDDVIDALYMYYKSKIVEYIELHEDEFCKKLGTQFMRVVTNKIELK